MSRDCPKVEVLCLDVIPTEAGIHGVARSNQIGDFRCCVETTGVGESLMAYRESLIKGYFSDVNSLQGSTVRRNTLPSVWERKGKCIHG